MKRIRSLVKNKSLIAQRRNEIFRGAANLFLKKGYSETSMQELADTLGMTKPSLYHYIGSKEDIIHLIVEYSAKYDHNIVNQLSESVHQNSATQHLRDAIRLYIIGVDENQDIHNLNNHVVASMPKEIRQKMFADYEYVAGYFKENIQKGIESGEFKKVNAKLVAENLMLMMQAWAYRRWTFRKDFTLEEYIKQQTDFIINSIKKSTD